VAIVATNCMLATGLHGSPVDIVGAVIDRTHCRFRRTKVSYTLIKDSGAYIFDV